MANKRLQGNQNKKNTESATMNGNSSTSTSSSIQNVQQNSPNPIAASSNATQYNNNSATSNGTTTIPTTTNSSAASSAPQQNQSHSQHSHQKLSTTSSSSQQSSDTKQPLKKIQHNEVEKIYLQINNTGASHTSQANNGYRNNGSKDQKTKEKEKEKAFQGSGRQGNQPNHHHHHLNHNTGGGGGGNRQNHAKKDGKFQNRDQSNQSHRGGFLNNHSSHNPQHQCSHAAELVKSSGIPHNSSLSSTAQTSAASAASTAHTVPTAPSIPVVSQESKTVQTDEPVEKKEKVKSAKKEEAPAQFKSTDPKDMDTIVAFKEHDEWNKVELMCELISYLSPTDLRLLGTCIEGSLRCYTNQMRPVEKTSNCPNPTGSLPPYLCSPVTPQFSSFPSLVPETNVLNQRSMPALIAHPPGLPPLMPNIAFPVDANYQNPSSSTPPIPPISAPVTIEVCNGSISTSSTTCDSKTPSDPPQQETHQNATKVTDNSTTTVQQSSTKVPRETEVPSASTANPTRPPSNTLQQSTTFMPEEPEKFLQSVRDITSYLYMLMSVCASTNRKSAAKISDYIKDVIVREKVQILERIPDELDKIDVLQDIGKIVAAMTHHPAVSVDDKIVYGKMRFSLRAEIESLFRLYYSPERVTERKRLEALSIEGVGDVGDEEDDSDDEDTEEFTSYFSTNEASNRLFGSNTRTHSSSTTTFFITRFIGRHVDKKDDLFSVEIHWSDGDCTFTQRSASQLRALQHRLLDAFGQQRSEKYQSHGTTSSFSSFDEENKKLSTSTSTMETALASSGERIIPRLACDATPAQFIQYINELSDLPARIMLSTVICEEFNGTRSRTEDLLQEARESSDGLIYSRWKNPRTKSPVRYFQRNSEGNIDPIELPVALPPFLYSNPHMQFQMLCASCSNCGGNHTVKNCEKPTLLGKKALAEHKMRLNPEGPAMLPLQVAGGNSSINAYSPLHPQMTHQMFADNTQVLMGNNHFQHHPQQHIIQNTMYHNGIPSKRSFRTNGQFETPIQMTISHSPLYYTTQPVVHNANNSSGNTGSGGASQNSNF